MGKPDEGYIKDYQNEIIVDFEVKIGEGENYQLVAKSEWRASRVEQGSGDDYSRE